MQGGVHITAEKPIEHNTHSGSPTRRRLLLGSGAAGLLVLGGGFWELVRDPVLNKLSPELHTISPAWHDEEMTRIAWQSFTGDAGRKKDDKSPMDKVAVAALTTTDMHKLLSDYPGSVPAAAYELSRTKGRMTTLGSTHALGEFTAKPEEHASPDKYYGVGFMLGATGLRAAIGIETAESTFVTTDNGIAYERVLSLDELPHELPGVPALLDRP